MDCFKTSSQDALNATLLYDDNFQSGNLWMRDNLQVPLPLCSCFSHPDSLCQVCRSPQDVYAVCSNLTDGVKMVMEGGGVAIETVKSECPKALCDDDLTKQLDGITIFLIVITLLAILIIIGVVYYKQCKSKRSRDDFITRGAEPLTQVMM